MMPYAIGVALALWTVGFARVVGFDRDRAFYPVVLIIIASYYVLFAVMGESMRAVMIESIAMTVFAVVAVAGFRFNIWLVVGALAGHGIFDLFHGQLIANPGVPPWWPQFCLAYDVVIAAAVAIVIRGRAQVSAATRSGTIS